jgi:hypothetical protein
MKIITRKELIEYPTDVIFSYYSPCCFNGLHAKYADKTFGAVDFLIDDLIAPIECNDSEEFVEKCELMEKGGSADLDFEYTGREGLFEDKQLFAIYEKKDIEKLIKRLQNVIK